MKIVIRNLTVVLGLLLLLSSCEDFLVREPVLQQTSELTLSTMSGLSNATVGAYTPLYSVDWYGSSFVLSSEMRGGNGKTAPQNAGYQVDPYIWNYTPNSTENLWGTAYTAIARANNVINSIPNYEGSEEDDADLKHYEAECLFIRAIAHFDLVRLYAQPYTYDKTMLGVPVVLLTEMGEPARNTVEEVYKQVVKDLKNAEILFGTYSITGGADPTAFATKEAAQALLARVYLTMGDWDNAAIYATKVISSGKYTMWTAAQYVTVSENAAGAWGREAEGSEVIFSIYSSLGSTGFPGQEGIPYMTNEGGHGDAATSNDLLSLFEANDVRRDLFSTSTDPVNAGVEWTKKYPSKTGDFNTNNTPVLRLSEMYLTRAEAIYNGATVAGVTALDDYNMVRENRGLAERTQILSANEIANERRRELCFEGQNFFDLARTGTDLVRIDYAAAVNQNITFKDKAWALPIPVGEINANENMEQNPTLLSNLK